MTAARPLIGVTGPDRGGAFAWACAWVAIRAAGGRARWLRPGHARDVDAAVHGLCGIVIGGGADVDPARYGETLMTNVRKEQRTLKIRPFKAIAWIFFYLMRVLFSVRLSGIDKDRDGYELVLLGKALEAGLPVLGICRGAQLLNVHLGGSLDQTLEEFYVETPQIRSFLPRKCVNIEPGSKLSVVLGRRRCRVNSLHRQAVGRLGKDVRVSARELNGVVQAIEHASSRFVIGVQWHPEFLPQRREQRAIFESLVAHAAQVKLSDAASARPRYARP